MEKKYRLSYLGKLYSKSYRGYVEDEGEYIVVRSLVDNVKDFKLNRYFLDYWAVKDGIVYIVSR